MSKVAQKIKPIKPFGPYVVFRHEMMSKLPQDEPNRGIKCLAMWRALAHEERKRRDDDYSRELEEWKGKMEEWKEKYGEEEVIHKRALREEEEKVIMVLRERKKSMRPNQNRARHHQSIHFSGWEIDNTDKQEPMPRTIKFWDEVDKERVGYLTPITKPPESKVVQSTSDNAPSTKEAYKFEWMDELLTRSKPVDSKTGVHMPPPCPK